jgi:hypothetical protein
MGAITMYLLFALMQGPNGSMTLTQLASFDDQSACEAAVDAVKAALSDGGTPAVEFGCISTDALGALR